MTAAINIEIIPAQIGLQWLAPTKKPDTRGLKAKALAVTEESVPSISPWASSLTCIDTIAVAVGKSRLIRICCKGIYTHSPK